MNPGSPQFNAALLRDARSAFPEFYRLATPDDVRRMDAVVLGHAAMVVLLNAPRESVASQVRGPLERVSDGVDQLFAAAREALRACPTFKSIRIEERDDIERLLLEVKPSIGSE